jgi:Glyoxalase-like domain
MITCDDAGMPARFKDLVIDAADHHKLADWWCAAMGYARQDEHEPPADGWLRPLDWPVPIVDPTGRGPAIWIVPVTEGKTVKNRMHLDVWGDVGELVELGATVLRERDDEIEWNVLADPEGNEFCVFSPPA